MSPSPPSTLPAQLRPPSSNPHHLDARAGPRRLRTAGELREKIWTLYSCRLQDLLQEQQQSSRADDDNGLTTSSDRRDF